MYDVYLSSIICSPSLTIFAHDEHVLLGTAEIAFLGRLERCAGPWAIEPHPSAGRAAAGWRFAGRAFGGPAEVSYLRILCGSSRA